MCWMLVIRNVSYLVKVKEFSDIKRFEVSSLRKIGNCLTSDQPCVSRLGSKQLKMSLTDSSALEIAKSASVSSRSLAILPTEARNSALAAIHHALKESKESILAANTEDLKLATKAAEDGELSQSVLKRLDLGRKGKWDDMLQGIIDVRNLEDPGRL